MCLNHPELVHKHTTYPVTLQIEEVQYSRTTPNSSNLLELPAHRDSKVDRLLSHEWFDWTEPSPTIYLQGIQSVQGSGCTSSGRFGSEIALVREGALPQSEATRQPDTPRRVSVQS